MCQVQSTKAMGVCSGSGSGGNEHVSCMELSEVRSAKGNWDWNSLL